MQVRWHFVLGFKPLRAGTSRSISELFCSSCLMPACLASLHRSLINSAATSYVSSVFGVARTVVLRSIKHSYMLFCVAV